MGQDPRRSGGVPFVENVMVDDILASFMPVTFDYDGTSDTCDHICRFDNTALLHRYYDGVKYMVFVLLSQSPLKLGLANWETGSFTILSSLLLSLCNSYLVRGSTCDLPKLH